MPAPSGSSSSSLLHRPNQVRVLALMSIILVLISTTLLLLAFTTVRCDHDESSFGPRGPGRQNDIARQKKTTSEESYATTNKLMNLVSADANQLAAGGRVAQAHGPHRLFKRWAGATRKSRVQLAQRPPKSTTTTTTSTTSTTTTEGPSKRGGDENSAEKEDQEEVAPESGDTGDYEEIGRAKQKPAPPLPPSSTTQAAPSEAEQEEEEEAEEEVEEQEEVTTTTTTTTTPRPRKSTGGARRKSSKKPVLSGDDGQPSRSKTTPSRKTPPAILESDDKMAAEEEPNTISNKTDKDGGGGGESGVDNQRQHHKKKALLHLPFIRPKNTSSCTPEAYKEFPRDLIGDKWRARGGVLIHVAVVCYMFYSLALVCERYFMPSLEEFAQRLQLSEDVAGATLMSAGSSAPELFTAILGVFVAKGDVGTGAIVGSAVFNILFVIGLCAFVSTTSAQLQWWPVLRDSIYYTFTVLVLIFIIYDERITAYESASMIVLYGVYIAIMAHNEQIKQLVSNFLLSYPLTAKLVGGPGSGIQVDGPDDVFGGGASSTSSMRMQQSYELNSQAASSRTVEEDSIFMAALLVIVKHKRLFRSQLRFQSAARYIIIKRQHRAMRQQQRQLAANEEVNYFGPESEGLTGSGAAGHSAAQRAKMEAYARSATASKQKFSIVSKDDYEFWHRPPNENENYYLWMARIPINYVLHYTIPDCTLYPDKYIITFFVSIVWTAIFSYIMVWMVTLIGYTLGIPDSVMGVTFLAAGTSVPDCYSSLHAARNGMADMAVSNSIGSNVFDILIGLAVPWFIQSAIYPGVVATVNSRGVIYSVILLFLSLIVTIYLLNKYDWSLQPRLGLALLIAYGLFIILTSMLEFNLFGHVNPPPC